MKKILLSLLLVSTISIFSCSTNEQQNQNETTVFNKEVDSTFKPGDTLPKDTDSYFVAEYVKQKFIDDSTTIGTEFENEYGRAHIVCRDKYTLHSNDIGGSWQVAHGCLYSNGRLYSYTWWPDHYVTPTGGGPIFVPAGSRYVLNPTCSCD